MDCPAGVGSLVRVRTPPSTGSLASVDSTAIIHDLASEHNLSRVLSLVIRGSLAGVGSVASADCSAGACTLACVVGIARARGANTAPIPPDPHHGRYTRTMLYVLHICPLSYLSHHSSTVLGPTVQHHTCPTTPAPKFLPNGSASCLSQPFNTGPVPPCQHCPNSLTPYSFVSPMSLLSHQANIARATPS